MSKQGGMHSGADNGGEFLVYRAEDGQIKLEVRLQRETVWLTQQQMADLFQTTKQNISLHLQNIYAEGELDSGATVKRYLTFRREGSREVHREPESYNLDAVPSVRYRPQLLGRVDPSLRSG